MNPGLTTVVGPPGTAATAAEDEPNWSLLKFAPCTAASVALGGGLTEIDRAITAASEKENAASSADVAASVLKRRMEVQQEQAKGEKSARLK